MDHVTFLNVFNMETLTDSVNRIPEVPSMLSRYFEEDFIDTTNAFLDVEGEGVVLVADSPRGDNGPKTGATYERKGVPMESAHLVLSDAIKSEDIQNERAFGTTGLTTVDMMVLKKQARLRRSIEATLEYHRVGAVCGKVMDADGSTVLYDLYKKFGLEENEAENVTWPADVSGKNNALTEQFDDLADRIEAAVGGNVITGIVAIVGAEFWSYLTSNPLTRNAYDLWMSRQNAFGDLAKDMPFRYGGIEWIRYNKTVGGTTLVAKDEAHVFPVGPGMLKHYFAPADYIDAVNRPGLKFYSCAEMGRMGKGIDLEVQSNPITLHKFPEALFTLKSQSA